MSMFLFNCCERLGAVTHWCLSLFDSHLPLGQLIESFKKKKKKKKIAVFGYRFGFLDQIMLYSKMPLK